MAENSPTDDFEPDQISLTHSKHDNSNNVEVRRNSSTRSDNKNIKQMRGYKIADLNIRSLIKNMDQYVADHEIDINGYDIIREDRNRHGGGVAMYVRSSIDYKVRYDLMTDNLETITDEICKPKAKPFLLNTWYRPPNTSLELFNSYEELVKNMDSEGNEIILIRDFNCDWSREKDKLNSQTNKLVDIANLFQLEQFIKQPRE